MPPPENYAVTFPDEPTDVIECDLFFATHQGGWDELVQRLHVEGSESCSILGGHVRARAPVTLLRRLGVFPVNAEEPGERLPLVIRPRWTSAVSRESEEELLVPDIRNVIAPLEFRPFRDRRIEADDTVDVPVERPFAGDRHARCKVPHRVTDGEDSLPRLDVPVSVPKSVAAVRQHLLPPAVAATDDRPPWIERLELDVHEPVGCKDEEVHLARAGPAYVEIGEDLRSADSAFEIARKPPQERRLGSVFNRIADIADDGAAVICHLCRGDRDAIVRVPAGYIGHNEIAPARPRRNGSQRLGRRLTHDGAGHARSDSESC